MFSISVTITSARRRRRKQSTRPLTDKTRTRPRSRKTKATATARTYCVIFIHSSPPASQLYTLVHFCQQSSIKPAPEPGKRNNKGRRFNNKTFTVQQRKRQVLSTKRCRCRQWCDNNDEDNDDENDNNDDDNDKRDEADDANDETTAILTFMVP